MDNFVTNCQEVCQFWHIELFGTAIEQLLFKQKMLNQKV